MPPKKKKLVKKAVKKEPVSRKKIEASFPVLRNWQSMGEERQKKAAIPGISFETLRDRRDFCFKNLGHVNWGISNGAYHTLRMMLKNDGLLEGEGITREEFNRDFFQLVQGQLLSDDKKERGKGLLAHGMIDEMVDEEELAESLVFPVDKEKIIGEHLGSDSPEYVRNKAMRMALESGNEKLLEKAVQAIPNETKRIRETAAYHLGSSLGEIEARIKLLGDSEEEVRGAAMFEFPGGILPDGTVAELGEKLVGMYSNKENHRTARGLMGKLAAHGLTFPRETVDKALGDLESEDFDKFSYSAALAQTLMRQGSGFKLTKKQRKALEKGLETPETFWQAAHRFEETNGLPKSTRADKQLAYMGVHWNKKASKKERDKMVKTLGESIRFDQESASLLAGSLQAMAESIDPEKRAKKLKPINFAPTEEELNNEIIKYYLKWEREREKREELGV